MCLKSQSLTVWSTEAVANSQSQRELNSAWVTLALCNFSLKIYKNKAISIKWMWTFMSENWWHEESIEEEKRRTLISSKKGAIDKWIMTFWPSKLSSSSCPTLSPVTNICLLTDTSTQQNQQLPEHRKMRILKLWFNHYKSIDFCHLTRHCGNRGRSLQLSRAVWVRDPRSSPGTICPHQRPHKF